MPIIKSDFFPPLHFRNAHMSTIYRPLFMKVKHQYKRIRVDTWDGDFIDLDFSKVGSSVLVLLIHGLEGSSASKYMLSASKELNAAGYDAVCFNLRGCSGEDNRLLSTYHSGKTDDVDFIVSYVSKNYSYDKIFIVGYSLGGNLTLKYLGEYAYQISDKIIGGVAVSVPIHLESSSRQMALLKNKIYMEEFLKTLRLKVLKKAHNFPAYQLDKDRLFKAKNFKDFDELYTAPVFGFDHPEDYWEKASSKPYISKIQKPAYLISSLDDPSLSPECYPFEEAKSMDNFYLLATKYGGHVGFTAGFKQQDNCWLDQKIIRFLEDCL